jgi:predicted RNA-binding Zn-ribbon protein involved in translation (DUF1610 family)
MGYKTVCFNCRKSFSAAQTKIRERKCPQCGKAMTWLSHRFRPPKNTDDKKWKVVEFLAENGFDYDHIWKSIQNGVYSGLAVYPETMKDAEEFAEKYKAQARKRTNNMADTVEYGKSGGKIKR